MMGIDQDAMNQELQAAAERPSGGNYPESKMDFTGKTRMVYSNMGQFQPIYPGKEKASEIVDSLSIVILGSKFWPEKTEAVEGDDGKTKRRTVCQSASCTVEGAVREGKEAYVAVPEWGIKNTVDKYGFRGTQNSEEFGFGDCRSCQFNGMKGQDGCKVPGYITAVVIGHDQNKGIPPYVTDLRCNYTSGIQYAKFLDELKKKAEFAGINPRHLLVKAGLVKNTMGTNAYYELHLDPVMNYTADEKSRTAVEQRIGVALNRYKADREAQLKAREEAKQIKAAEAPAAIEAPAVQDTSGATAAPDGTELAPF